MPFAAPRICACGRKVPWDVRCACQRQRKAELDKRRPTARQRGYDTQWQRESKAFLARPENRFCACGCGRVANMVDHIQPHRGDPKLFWDRRNWQPMAASPCHSQNKQAAERRADGVRYV
jgi:5-methylcytosine-specific restriction protein A